MAASMPLYKTIARDLKGEIRLGRLAPGQMLYSENKLAKRYSTSRMTIRKSLALLEDEGYIYPEQGKGYFVSKPAHDKFTLTFTDEEDSYEIKYHYIHVIRPNEELQRKLQMDGPKPVIIVCRLAISDAKAVAVDYKYLPFMRGTPTLESEMKYAVFPEIVAERTAPFAFHTRMELSAEPPTGEVCDLLGCAQDTPLLVVRRYFLDTDNQMIGYGIKYQLEEYGRLIAVSGYEVDHDRE